MLLILSLVISIFASSQCFLFGQPDIAHHYDFFYTYCHQGAPSPSHSYFCEPFFEYFKGIVKPFPSVDECQACATVVSELRKEGEVKRVVDNLIDTITTRFCTTLDSSVRESCKQWVQEHSTEIKEMTKKLTEEGTLCEYILNCKDKPYYFESAKYFEIENKEKPNQVCDTCKRGVQMIEKRMLKGLSFKDLFHTLDNLICQNVAVKVYPNCYETIRVFSQKFLKIALKFEDSSSICTDLKLCQRSSEKKTYYNFFYYFFHEKKTHTEICETCTKVTPTQFEELANTVTVDNWKSIGYTLICEEFSEQDVCKSFVDKVMVPFVEQIRKLLTKENLCYGILQCPSERPYEHFFFQDFSYFFDTPSKKNVKSECLICEIISKILLKTLDDPRTKVLTDLVYRLVICGNRRTNVDTCNELAKTELPRMFTVIADRLRKGHLCNKMCSIVEPTFMEHFLEQSDSKCVICKKIIKLIKEKIGKKYSDKKFVQLKIDEACEQMPPLYAAACRNLMLNHRPEIIRLLMLNHDPETICIKIKQCSPKDKSAVALFDYAHFPFYQKYFSENGYFPFSFYFNSEPTYINKFFESYFPYTFYYFKHGLHPQGFAVDYFSYPYEFFSKHQSHPFEYFSEHHSYPYSFFESHPFKYFGMEKSPIIPSSKQTDCQICKHFVEELKNIHSLFKTNPTFWRTFVNGICEETAKDQIECPVELAKYFEKIFKVIDSGESVTTLCNKSCSKFDSSIVLCFFQPEKYCKTEHVSRCGEHGVKFCHSYYY